MTIDEVKQEAERVRVLHNVHAVCVMSIENDQCPFGISIALDAEDIIMTVLPEKLREIADKLEQRNVSFETKKVLVP